MKFFWFAILFFASFAHAQVSVYGSLQTAFAPWSKSGINLNWVGAGSGTCAGGTDEIRMFPDDSQVAVIEWATMDLVESVSPQDHIECIEYLISYLQVNRPAVKRVVVVNAPPAAKGNNFPFPAGTITSDAVAAYNQLYSTLPDQFPGGYVQLADMRGILWISQYARPPYMNGKYGIIFGSHSSSNWDYFFSQIKRAMN